MEKNRSGINTDFIKIKRPSRRSRKRRRPPIWPRLALGILVIVGLIFGICAFLYSSQGQPSPQAVAERYMTAAAADKSGAIYRLFPQAIQSRHSGSRTDLVEQLDDFVYAYGRDGDWSILSTEAYSQSSLTAFNALLDADITDYQHLTLQKDIDGRTRNIHLDVIQIGGKWYLAEVWNDDVLPANGAASPEEAVDLYLAAFAANDAEGMALALAPALLDRAIEENYGLRAMLGEIDDFYAAGLSANPVSYTLTQTKDYSAYQAQSIAEVLGTHPQIYRAFYYEATLNDTVYTLVIDLVQINDRWGITAVWDYNKSYII